MGSFLNCASLCWEENEVLWVSATDFSTYTVYVLLVLFLAWGLNWLLEFSERKFGPYSVKSLSL